VLEFSVLICAPFGETLNAVTGCERRVGA